MTLGRDPFSTSDLWSGTLFPSLSVRHLSSLSFFKSKLETHLFSSACWSVVFFPLILSPITGNACIWSVCACVMKWVYPCVFVSALGSYEMRRHKYYYYYRCLSMCVCLFILIFLMSIILSLSLRHSYYISHLSDMSKIVEKVIWLLLHHFHPFTPTIITFVPTTPPPPKNSKPRQYVKLYVHSYSGIHYEKWDRPVGKHTIAFTLWLWFFLSHMNWVSCACKAARNTHRENKRKRILTQWRKWAALSYTCTNAKHLCHLVNKSWAGVSLHYTGHCWWWFGHNMKLTFIHI